MKHNALNLRISCNNVELVKISGFFFKITRMFFCAIILAMSSCMNPFSCGPTGDQGIFACGASLMTNGGVIYKDYFDHKGPIFYIIEAVGYRLDGITGIWIAEIITCTLAFLMISKIIDLYTYNNITKMAAFVMSFACFAGWFCRGNMTEEFAVFPIATSLYIFIKYFRNESSVGTEHVVIAGMMFGIILGIRPNMIGVWLGCIPIIIYKLCKEKKYIKLVSYIFQFILGVVIIVVPVLLWLMKNDALKNMIDDYIIFNFLYSEQGVSNLLVTYGAFFKNMCLFGLPLWFAIWFYSKFVKIKINYENLSILLALICSVILANYSGYFFTHYYMVIIPLYSILFAVGFESLMQKSHQIHNLSRYKVVICILTIIFSLWAGKMYCFFTITNNSTSYNRNIENIKELSKFVNSFIEEKDSIYSTLGPVFYLYSEHYPTVRFSYFPYIDEKKGEFQKEEFVQQFNAKRPEWIFVEDGWEKQNYDRMDLNCVKENIFLYYKKITSYQGMILWRCVV